MEECPRIKFRISARKDVQTFFAFASEAESGDNVGLEWAVLKPYPYFERYVLNGVLDVSKQKVREFVREKYDRNKDLVKNNLLAYEAQWRQIENSFYGLTDELFPGQRWPTGKYVAYTTIWGMYPRFLEDKTFQIPYRYPKKEYVNVVIAHEMLHFIFYDFFRRNFKKYDNEKYDSFVWHVSEIFNAVIQSLPEWVGKFELKSFVYPEHREIVAKLLKSYRKKSAIGAYRLMEDIIKEMSVSH